MILLSSRVKLLNIFFSLFPTIKIKCDEEFNLNFKAWEEVNYHPEL